MNNTITMNDTERQIHGYAVCYVGNVCEDCLEGRAAHLPHVMLSVSPKRIDGVSRPRRRRHPSRRKSRLAAKSSVRTSATSRPLERSNRATRTMRPLCGRGVGLVPARERPAESRSHL